MPESTNGTGVLQEVEVGRESAEMCLLSRLFYGFANPTRLSILFLLCRRGEMRVGELAEELGVPQPRVSDHLGCLSRCGYVTGRRQGRNSFYSVSDERVSEMIRLAEDLMRDGEEVADGPYPAPEHSLISNGRP